jgi:lycopene cyclase domain-containing protein
MISIKTTPKVYYLSFLLIAVYIVGIIGFFSPIETFVALLTPFNLIFCVLLLLINNENKEKKHYLYLITLFIAGLLIEIVGVNLGFPFGSYSYGDTLGFKILNVPIVMGFNWILVVFCIGTVLQHTALTNFQKSLLGGVILMIFDMVIEFFAINYDLWVWEQEIIPFQNYLSWFVLSAILLYGYFKVNFNKTNFFPGLVLSVQLIFFIIILIFNLSITNTIYLLVNVLSIFIPFAYSFEKKLQFHQNWKAVFFSTFFSGIFFIVWDILFTHIGIWGFNGKYLTGTKIFNLPFEEWLFFITIPFSCIFIYQNISYYFKINFNEKIIKAISYSLISIAILLSFIYFDRLYTIVVMFVFISFLLINIFVIKNNQLGKFYFSFIFVLITFILVNSILTGLYTEEPIVWYNNQENSEIRFLSIPLEDFFYCFSMILMNVNFYDYYKKNQTESKQKLS